MTDLAATHHRLLLKNDGPWPIMIIVFLVILGLMVVIPIGWFLSLKLRYPHEKALREQEEQDLEMARQMSMQEHEQRVS